MLEVACDLCSICAYERHCGWRGGGGFLSPWRTMSWQGTYLQGLPQGGMYFSSEWIPLNDFGLQPTLSGSNITTALPFSSSFFTLHGRAPWIRVLRNEKLLDGAPGSLGEHQGESWGMPTSLLPLSYTVLGWAPEPP